MSTQELIKAAVESSTVSRDELLKKYYDLCDVRDKVYEHAKEAEKHLAEANTKVIAAQEEAIKWAKVVEDVWGPNWIAFKKEIADLAKLLGRIPPRA